MNPLTAVAAANLGETVLSLCDLLRREHRKGQLLPWLRRAATEAFLLQQARALDLRVEDNDLQKAADIFRRRQQLVTADQFQKWLAHRRLSVDDFETALEERLLLEKLTSSVARGERVAERFGSCPANYDQLRLRQLVVAREDLAREILSQLNEEGADFSELALRHSIHPSRVKGGRVGPFFRRQLTGALREALAAAQTGACIGPVAGPDGFHVFLVDEVVPGQLDDATAPVIRQELYQEWLRERLSAAAFSAPLLDALA